MKVIEVDSTGIKRVPLCEGICDRGAFILSIMIDKGGLLMDFKDGKSYKVEAEELVAAMLESLASQKGVDTNSA